MKIEQTRIHLHQMHFYAHHGVLAQETATGAHYTVDLVLTLSEAELAIRADKLEGTVNYAEVYACLGREMLLPSQLLEHAAGRMAEVLLSTFPRIDALRIRLTKDTPPITGFDGRGVSVELDVKRND